ncbi:MAG TPA: HlyD family efflux transporter periplasmic adaptor subunit [Thermoanaerobaculia bacterium]
MDREIAPEVRRRSFARRTVVIVVTLAIAVLAFGRGVEWLRPSIERGSVTTARVERGAVDATLQATGTIVPAFEQAVASPVEARVLRIVRRAGDRVQPGDELITLDTTTSRLELDRNREKIAQKQNETAQLRLRHEETLAGLRASIEQKKLDVDIYRYQAEQNRRLREAGLVSEQSYLAADTMSKKSSIELAQLGEALVRAQRTADAQLAAAAMELRMLTRDQEESGRQLQLAAMRAERTGVVTSIIQEEGTVVRRGDVIARVADLSSFRVLATISDLHASRVTRGMRVRVRLEDRTELPGTIAGIEPRIENGTVKFYVDLDESSPKLRNNLRVDVFVVSGRRDGVLRLRRGALGQREREDVFVVDGDHATRRTVRYGFTGDDYVEIAHGLNAGDEVIISNMSSHEGVKKLKIKE